MPRIRRERDDLRELLLESALVEFGALGFDGASTRAIAERADAHQPQINYHFSSKEALWAAAVDHLFALLRAAVGEVPRAGQDVAPDELGEAAAATLRRFVRFAAAHPELNQIMIHEATKESERLCAMVERHVQPLYQAITALWTDLRAAGIGAPIDPTMAHHLIVGGASLPFVTAPETRLLTGVEPTDPAWVETYADGLVATLLPGLATAPRPPSRNIVL